MIVPNNMARQIETRFFRVRPRLTKKEQEQREVLRRAKTRERTGRWRQSLYDRREPELRHLSEALLKAFLRTKIIDDPTHDMTRRFLEELISVGFDPVASLRKAKKLKRYFAGQ